MSEIELAKKPSPSSAEAAGAEEAKEVSAPMAPLADVFSNATSYDYLLMVLGIIGAMGTGVSLPLFNVLFGEILDNLNGDPNSFSDAIAKLCIDFVILASANIVAGFLQVYCWSATGERQTQRFRERYVNAVLSQEIGWFDTCGAAELSTKLAETVGKVQDGMGRKVGDLAQYLTQVIASLVVAFYLNWKLTAVLLCAMPIIGASGAFMINAVTAAQHKSLEQYSKAGGLATETLNAIRTVTALNLQPSALSRYREFLFEALQVGMWKGLQVGLGNGGVFCACFLTYALGFWYGGKLVADDMARLCTKDCLTGGDVMAVFFSTIMGSMALGQVAPPLTSFSQARAAIATLMETIRRRPLIDGLSDEGLRPEHKVKGEVRLRNIQFAYPSRPHLQVCKGYDLHIQPGETVALVGPSGCGKSTVINLLLRFYDPQAGSIHLDDYETKDLNIKWLRSQIGYVGQEPVLFAGSILENIAFGLDPELRYDALSAEEKEKIRAAVVTAAMLAHAHEFIMRFPKGYDTAVGAGGVALSGGQKQRLAIARALIKRPAVLLLDEATSALDTASERIVQQSIDALSRGHAQTTIIIAHRLSTIRNADKICVINNGVIAEQGTHDDLLARDGLYADLVRLQLTEELGNDDDNAKGEEEEEEVEGAESVRVDLHNDEDKEKNIEEEEAKKDADVNDGEARPEDDIESGTQSKNELALTPHTTDQTHTEKTKGEDDDGDNEEEEVSKEEGSRLWRRIWSYIMRFPGLLSLGMVGACIFGAIFPCWGYLLARTQDMFYLPNPDDIREKASLYACFYILFAGVSLLSSIAQFYGVVGLGEKVSSTLRSEMFESLLRREISFFDDEANSVGVLATRLADDSRVVNKAFGESLAKQLQAVFTLLIGLGLGFSASWQIAFVVLACFPISIVSSAIQMQAMAGQQYDQQSEDSSAPANASQSKSDKKQKKEKSNKGKDKEKSKNKGKNKSKAQTQSAEKESNAGSAMSGGHGTMIATAFTNMRTVSAFSLHHQVSQRYSASTAKISEQRIHRSLIAGLGFGGSNGVLFLTYALLFWYGSELIKDGDTSFVDLMTSIMTLMLGALGLGQALADMGDQRTGMKIAKRIFADIDAARNSSIDGLSTTGLEQMKKTDETDIPRAEGCIELRDVHFHYPTRPDIEVCKGYNLTIEKGQTVALVGPSGSGKSTIISLLLRFYDPIAGQVLLDGKDIKDLNVRWLRSQIGYVGQEPVLFAGSVAENVARGRAQNVFLPVLSLEEAMQQAAAEQQRLQGDSKSCLDYFAAGQREQRALPTSEEAADLERGDNINDDTDADADIIEACQAANAHDFVSTFPNKYRTDIGQGSIMVSGGQKQRLAIARALIKRPAVLLLDEATSALDAASERIVQQSIDALSSSHAQTTIIIAHRLSTIRNANKICVVEHGRIVESGTHEELLALPDGLYKQLWEKQSGPTNSDAEHH